MKKMKDLGKRALAGFLSAATLIGAVCGAGVPASATEETVTPAYKIHVHNTDEYTLTAWVNATESNTACAGDEVTVTVDSGVNVYHLTVVNKNKEVLEVKQADNGAYTFEMPDEEVWVMGDASNVNPYRRAGGSTTVTVKDSRFNNQAPISYFEVNGLDGKTHMAFCCYHELMPPKVGWDMPTLAKYTGNELIRKVLWYGYGGPGELEGVRYADTSLGCSVAMGHMDVDETGEMDTPIGKNFVNRVSGLAAPPSSFEVYVVRNNTYAYGPTNDYDTWDKYQALCYWIYNPEGKAALKKESANTSISAGNSSYSLEGAVYTIYSDSACTKSVGTFTTKADGTTNEVTLNAGTYYVKETTSPKGFVLDTAVHKLTVSSGETATLKVKDEPKSYPVDVLLAKYDSELGYKPSNSPQGAASLEGAQFLFSFYYGEYKTIGSLSGVKPVRTWTCKTDTEGKIRLDKEHLITGDEFWYDTDGDVVFPIGTLTVKEIQASEGYLLNEGIFLYSVASNATNQILNSPLSTVPEQVVKGGIKIVKFGSDPDDKDNVKTPLEGIKFVLTSKTNGKTFTITTDKNGEAYTNELPYDSYVVTENNTPKNYMPCKEFEVVINAQDKILNYIVENKEIKAAIAVVKTDAETNEIVKVAGATFRILDADKKPISMRVSYPSNQVVDTFKTDENGSFTLPERLKYGTYYLEELQAPHGYLKGELLEFTVERGFDWDEPLTISFSDQPVKGMIGLQKVASGGDSEPLKGVEFEVRAAEDIITPDGTIRANKGDIVDTIVTDDEGEGLSKKLYLGKYEVKESKAATGYVLDETVYGVELVYADQVTEIVTKDLGTIENIPTEIVLKKYKKDTDEVLKGVTFSIWAKDSEEVKDYVTDENGTIHVKCLPANTTYCIQEKETLPGYVPNKEIIEFFVDEKGLIEGKSCYEFTIENDYTQMIGTTALDLDTAIQNSKADEEVTIIDTVAFKNLVPGEEYTVKGILMDKETDEPLLVNGEEVRAETTFVAEETDGTIDVTFTFDASALAGKTVVVFEEAYTQNVLIAVHTDIEDDGQTIHFPEVGTTALDAENATHHSKPDEEVTIVDTVEYKNLIPDMEYTVKGILMDKETGEPLLVNDKVVEAETTFTAEKADGTVEIVFVFDGSAFAGKTVVAFETVSVNEKEVAVHTDIEDEEQTIHFPEIGTTALDQESNSHNAMADEKVTIVDTVEYKNLIPGMEYTVKGILMDKATGKPLLINDEVVEAETTFTAEEPDGSITMEFTFDCSVLAGKTVVVFESVFVKEKEIAIHADIEDEGQTIHFPEIGTDATDKDSLSNNAKADEMVTIVDTVHYENLLVGEAYTVKGILMNKDTREPLLVNGEEVRAEATFVAEQSEGSIDLEFTFDGSDLAGETIVVFEALYLTEEDVLIEVAVHADIEDEEQTIWFPEVGTLAKDAEDLDKKAVADKNVTIVDTVKYHNLLAGKTYKLTGILMDKSTGKELLVDGKPVVSEVEFVPEKPDGTVDVMFIFNGSGLAGKDIVVFEELLLIDADSRYVVAEHKDIEDEGQTVRLTEIPRKPGPKTQWH